MKILFMTGSHPRHWHMAQAVHRSGMLAGLVIESREAFVPETPAGLSSRVGKLYTAHFAGRSECEARHFAASEGGAIDVPVRTIAPGEINGSGVTEFIAEIQPDLLLTYGVHKLTNATLNTAPGLRWNIHGGLSPWYRGVTTHFWPSYLLEPQMTGMTVHELTQQIDGGDIVHQCAAPLIAGDGLHDLSCRAVQALADELPELLALTASGRFARPVAQKTTGRVWRGEDWRPEHLIPIYETFENRVVDHYLAGEFGKFEPKLIRQI